MKKLLALLMALVMVVGVVGCIGNNTDTTPNPNQSPDANNTPDPNNSGEPTTEVPSENPVVRVEYDEFDVMDLNNHEYGEGKDYVSLYDQFGKNIKIADVIEDEETGKAYIEKDGKQYLLGLDFLSMAMVYNNDPAGSEYANEDEVYAAWWRLYITRWNMLLPEIPLYSNEYYDVFNTKITGVKEHPTNPFWGPAKALVEWDSTKTDKDIIIGNSTMLSGQFRYPTFGKSSPNAADNDIGQLTSGLETVSANKDGNFEWNEYVVESHEESVDADGNKTFTIKIKNDLKFSDGSAVTAKDYLAFSMAMYTPVSTAASGRALNAQTFLGGPDYTKYTGPGSTEGTKEFKGLRLIDEYTFSVTINADFIPYYYDITYASFDAQYAAAWLGDAEIKDDGNGCYLTDNFYAKDGDKYVMAEHLKTLCTDTSTANYTKYPWSGPYAVQSFDTTDNTAVLVRNEHFKGNYEGATPKIEKIIYRKVVDATQLQDLISGGVDFLAQITGGAATNEAIKAADESNGGLDYTHYSRAGYGKLGFRADYGPAQFSEVRKAIAYCMDRAQFAKDFTGGFGGVVDGPYYTGAWMYKEAVKQGMQLEKYPTSADSAIAVLEAGGWVYNADGSDYSGTGIRYKKIPGNLISENDKKYRALDNSCETVKIGDDYYMPLVINWFGTTPNEFTDQLQTGFRTNNNVTVAGMYVCNQLGEFTAMLDELYQQAIYGFYSGTPMFCAFNFATGYNSGVYDYSFNLTIDPGMYEDYSQYYIKDFADIYWLIER